MEQGLSLRDLIKREGLTQIDTDVFIKQEILGEGQFGKVLPGYVLDKDRRPIKAAIKMQKVQNENSRDLELFIKEIHIMEQLNHPCIVRFLKHGRSSKDGYVYVAMERLHLDLRQILKGYPHGMKEDDVRIYFADICAGVKHLHEQNVCHRDIKPENIMTDDQENLKLCDFGLATTLAENGTIIPEMKNSIVGTMPYQSPQLIMTEKYRGDKADVFALGKTLLYLLTGFLSDVQHVKNKSSPEGQTQLTHIFQANVKIPTSLSPSVRSLLERMLHPLEEKRPTMAEVCAHSWLNDRPELRLTCSMLNSTILQSKFTSQPKNQVDPVNLQKMRLIHCLNITMQKVVLSQTAAYVKTLTETLNYIARGDVSLLIEKYQAVDSLRYLRYFEIASSLMQIASAEFTFSSPEGQTFSVNLLRSVFETDPITKTNLTNWKEEVSSCQAFKDMVESLQQNESKHKAAGLWQKISTSVPEADQMRIFCPKSVSGADVEGFWLGKLGINSCALTIEVNEGTLTEYLLTKELSKLDIKEIKFHLMSLCRKGKILECFKEKTRETPAYLIPNFESIVSVKLEMDLLYKFNA